MNGLQSELIKYKRTFTRKLIILAPLFFVLQAVPQKIFMPAGYLRPWQLLTNLVFNWWPVIFLPLGMALFAALVDSQEKKAGSYHSLRSRNTSPMHIWVNKVAAMAIHAFFATAVLAVSIVLAGLITANGAVPWTEIIAACIVSWASSLALIPIQLWAATWNGMFFSMAIGFAGMLAGVFAAAKPYWLAIPWSWTTRLMCPIIGVHPNGLLLETADPLRDVSVIPIGIGLSLIVFIAVTAITAVWFSKREVN